jgi:hypothetical protein
MNTQNVFFSAGDKKTGENYKAFVEVPPSTRRWNKSIALGCLHPCGKWKSQGITRR